MFTFKEFAVADELTAMKVGTDGVLLGAWAAGGNRILDVGTGSGLIALMMAQRFPNAEIVGIDIDSQACRQAEINVSRSAFEGRITIVNASLQDFVLKEPKGSFDAIVSNPPYFQNSLKSPDKQRTMARHTDSLPFRDLMAGAKALLGEGGIVSVIGPADAESDIESEAIISGMTTSKTVLLKTKENKKPGRFMSQFVNGVASNYDKSVEVLMNPAGLRSEWYYELTKDFYIK